MKNQIFLLIITLGFFSLLTSCENDTQDNYLIEIINETGLEINNLTLESESKHNFSLKPNQSTGVFELILKRRGGQRRIEKRTCVNIEIESYWESSTEYFLDEVCVGCFVEKDFNGEGTTILKLKTENNFEMCGNYYFYFDK